MNQSCQSEVIKMVSTLQRKTQMYLNEQTRHQGITGSQAPFILITCENGEMIQNKFCELLEMDKSTVAKMLSKLEAEGYIIRKPDTADSRAMIVYPTRKSYDICAALEGFGNNWVNYLTSDMSDIEFAAFFSMLEKISDKAVDFFSDAPI